MTDTHSDPKNVIRGVRHQGRVVILQVGGEIDMQRSTKLRSKFMELFQDKPQVLVVNMTEVEFMDSSGLATLVEALKWCHRNDSQLRLVGLTHSVRNVFELSRLESMFQFFNSEDEAVSQ